MSNAFTVFSSLRAFGNPHAGACLGSLIPEQTTDVLQHRCRCWPGHCSPRAWQLAALCPNAM